MEGGPYRERPKFLLCPRCGEMLDRAFDAVQICLRCEGVWMAPISIEKAFGTPSWPEGQNAWWRSSLNCPECASEGKTTLLGGEMIDQVLLDRCRSHGIWLDRGELGRLMGGAVANADGDDDLAALRERLRIVDTELDYLLERRKAWRQDAETRRKSAAEYRAWLDAEQRNREELERAERERLTGARSREVEESVRIAAEQAAATREKLVTDAEVRARIDAERAAQREREKAQAAENARKAELAELERRIQRLGDSRVQASAHVSRVEHRIVELRKQVHDAEADLEEARGRLRALDDQVALAETQRDRT